MTFQFFHYKTTQTLNTDIFGFNFKYECTTNWKRIKICKMKHSKFVTIFFEHTVSLQLQEIASINIANWWQASQHPLFSNKLSEKKSLNDDWRVQRTEIKEISSIHYELYWEEYVLSWFEKIFETFNTSTTNTWMH